MSYVAIICIIPKLTIYIAKCVIVKPKRPGVTNPSITKGYHYYKYNNTLFV